MVGWSPLAGLAALCHVRELESDDAEAVTRETHGECVPEVGVHARPGVVREDDRSGRCRWAVDDQDIQWGLPAWYVRDKSPCGTSQGCSLRTAGPRANRLRPLQRKQDHRAVSETLDDAIPQRRPLGSTLDPLTKFRQVPGSGSGVKKHLPVPFE